MLRLALPHWCDVDEVIGARRREEREEGGEGCFAWYINLILWIPDRDGGRKGGGRGWVSPSLNIHRKEGIEIGCNRI